MANQVKLANVNISLQQFQKMSSGTYNAGEVRLTSETTLGKLNNHVIFTGWNGKSISHTEVLAIKEGFHSRAFGEWRGAGSNRPGAQRARARPKRRSGRVAALADAQARMAFVTDLANDPAGACKARIVVVRLLQERGIADYATLSVANKLDKHEALALASRLIGLDANVKGDERNAEVAANNGAIANKVAEFCGDVHPAQLSSVYFALSQAAASPVKDGFLNLGIKSDEHTALTYTLSKNAETGAITVTYSEPQGFPFHFHWTATISIDGTTTTPIMVERQ